MAYFTGTSTPQKNKTLYQIWYTDYTKCGIQRPLFDGKAIFCIPNVVYKQNSVQTRRHKAARLFFPVLRRASSVYQIWYTFIDLPWGAPGNEFSGARNLS